MDVLALREFADVLAPFVETLVALAGVVADAKWRADVIANDCCVREGAGEVDQIGKLWLQQPRVER